MSEASGSSLLEVRDLRVHFRRPGGFARRERVVRAVDGVSFDLRPGTTLSLVGESGCGKTTVARAILRLTPVTEGRVRFGGTDLLSLSGARLRRLRREIQMVFQDAAGCLDPRMTIGAIVAEPLAVHRLAGRRARLQQAGEMLERVGLWAGDADRYPHELSGGQRQRVGIARALILRPRLVVLDEPVSALDVSVQAQIINLLADLRADLGLTYLFIAHNLAVVEQVSDVVAVMREGRIVESADAVELFRCPRHPFTRELLASVPDVARVGAGGGARRAPPGH